tara:strand:+ start:2164 stop:2520 length:357 start_codon:yes stop_codon:yes gene_type:complete
MRFNSFQWGVIHGLAWVVCLADGWVLHNHVLFGVGLFFMWYSMWRMVMGTPDKEEIERMEREQASGWRKRQIAEGKTCQVCRLNPAEVKGRNSRGAPQWRCQVCHDLKNRAGFTKGKQ